MKSPLLLDAEDRVLVAGQKIPYVTTVKVDAQAGREAKVEIGLNVVGGIDFSLPAVVKVAPTLFDYNFELVEAPLEDGRRRFFCRPRDVNEIRNELIREGDGSTSKRAGLRAFMRWLFGLEQRRRVVVWSDNARAAIKEDRERVRLRRARAGASRWLRQHGREVASFLEEEKTRLEREARTAPIVNGAA